MHTRPKEKLSIGWPCIHVTATILALGFTLFLPLLPACTGTTTPEEWKPSAPIDFSYVLEGRAAKLADLRGRPLVLILMRTSEVPSQVYMAEVKKVFKKIAGVVRFLVLTVEQREAAFVRPYIESEKLPFSIGIAEPDVAEGLSPLGLIPTIPTTYLIDSKGRVYDAAAGVVRSDHLIQAIQRVDDR